MVYNIRVPRFERKHVLLLSSAVIVGVTKTTHSNATNTYKVRKTDKTATTHTHVHAHAYTHVLFRVVNIYRSVRVRACVVQCTPRRRFSMGHDQRRRRSVERMNGKSAGTRAPDDVTCDD